MTAAPFMELRQDGAPSDDDLSLIETGDLACEYQPIVRTSDESIWAYEALARFTVAGSSFKPDEVFRALHDQHARFFRLEARTKAFQILHRPRGARLFVNLDPDVCEGTEEVDHWVRELGREDDVIVELIENMTVSNLDNIRSFTRSLNDTGVNVALDDVGGAKNLFCFDLLDDISYLKLDRCWFHRLDTEPAYRALIEGLVAFSRARGIHTVLEGVESRRHLSIARSLGVDFVQGFLFRDAFEQTG